MSAKNLMEIVENSQIQPGRGEFLVGDTVDVHVKIVEGEKERVQIFTGIVIGRKGRGATESFTVRRLVGNEGVERVFPLHSPAIEKIESRKHGKIRRAKLYYLRDRVGKATRVAEKRGLEAAVGTAAPAPVEQAVKPRQPGSVPAKHEAAKPAAEPPAEKKS